MCVCMTEDGRESETQNRQRACGGDGAIGTITVTATVNVDMEYRLYTTAIHV